MIEPCNKIVTDIKGKELIPHGTALFPAACYGLDMSREVSAWHWHDEFEVTIELCGRRVICLEKERHVMDVGDAIFINSKALHYSEPFEGAPQTQRSMLFHPRLIGGIDSIFRQSYVQPVLDRGAMKGRLFRNGDPSDEKALGYIRGALDGFTSSEQGCEIDVRENLSRLMLLLSREAMTDERTPTLRSLRESERVRMMLQFIEEHYCENITARDIAESASVSVSESLRCFRSVIGVPPVRYLLQFRVQRAAERLISGNEMVSDIASECGFGEMSYFARIFREMKGSTPSEYRRRIKSGEAV